MTINTQSFPSMVQNAVSAMQGAASDLVDLTVGSILRAFVDAYCGLALWLQAVALQTASLTRFSTSFGEDADTWGADFSFPRLAPQSATGQLTFARFTPTQQASIPAAVNSGVDINGAIIWTGGAIAQTSDGTQQYMVIPDAAQSAYNASLNAYIIAASVASATVTVSSVNKSAAANAQVGQINVVAQAIPGVDTVTNAVAFANGEDAESDTSYHGRFPQFLASLSRATLAAIRFAIQSIGPNVDFTITENQTLVGVAQPGFFFVIADDGTGSPSGGFLTQVAAAIETVRGSTITYAVFAPTLITANIGMVISTASGFVHSAVVTAVQAALQAQINTLPIGADLPFTFVSSIAYGVPGVINVTSVTINSGTSDLTTTATQIIKAGTLSVS